MQLRHRDIVASFFLVILAHFTYNYNGAYDSLDVSIGLSFYTEFTSHVTIPITHNNNNNGDVDVDVIGDRGDRGDGGHPLRNKDGSMRHLGQKIHVAKPVPMDVDGDGIVEAIVIPSMIYNGEHFNNSAEPTKMWGLKILDLKPLHHKKKYEQDLFNVPFYPETMFETKLSSSSSSSSTSKSTSNTLPNNNKQTNAIPIQIKTGQIILRNKRVPPPTQTSSSTSNNKNKNDIDIDKSRHYYCGKDWFDASKCSTHCPSGSSTDCPEGESCFADTPCDLDQVEKELELDEWMEGLVKTPRGGLPSIVTVWSDGNVTMHSLTADKLKANNNDGKRNQKGTQTKLELREMWRINPFHLHHHITTTSTEKEGEQYINPIDFQELDVIIDTNTPIGKYGAVIIAARYSSQHHPIGDKPNESRQRYTTSVSSYYAIDAFTGESIWSHSTLGNNNKNNNAKKKPTTDESSSTPNKKQSSMARRRSRGMLAAAAHHHQQQQQSSSMQDNDLDGVTSEDCRNHFRHWIMDPRIQAMPHSYWDSSSSSSGSSINKSGKAIADDSKIVVTHFDRKHQYKFQHHHKTDFSKRPQKYMKPNVILFHNSDGINVFSLRNGRPVCHLSLLKDSLYADINQDGKIDHLQIITDNWQPTSYGTAAAAAAKQQGQDDISSPNDVYRANDRHVLDLAKRVADKTYSNDNEEEDEDSSLCHALLLSGIPANEELFSVHLCKARHASGRGMESRVAPNALQPVGVAPPILLERYDWEMGRSINDIVFALSNGVVKRYDAHGKLVWNTKSGTVGIPTWESGPLDAGSGFLGRIDFFGASMDSPITSSLRPIVISGHNSLAILSSARGQLLAYTDFPQSTIYRPILTDISGDGTTDVMVCSSDAIWGYRVVIRKGGSSFARIMFGLLILTIGVAALFNKYVNSKAYRRSTDL